MEIFAIVSTVIAVLGVIGTIFFFITCMKLVARLHEAEEVIDIKNEALKDSFEVLHEHNDKLWELREEIIKLKAPKKLGRPKGSKNKIRR